MPFATLRLGRSQQRWAKDCGQIVQGHFVDRFFLCNPAQRTEGKKAKMHAILAPIMPNITALSRITQQEQKERQWHFTLSCFPATLLSPCQPFCTSSVTFTAAIAQACCKFALPLFPFAPRGSSPLPTNPDLVQVQLWKPSKLPPAHLPRKQPQAMLGCSQPLPWKPASKYCHVRRQLCCNLCPPFPVTQAAHGLSVVQGNRCGNWLCPLLKSRKPNGFSFQAT